MIIRTLYAAAFLALLPWALNYVTQRAVWAWVMVMTALVGE